MIAEKTGNPKIRNFWLILGINENVGTLEIAMQDTLAVRISDPIDNLIENPG